MSDVNAVKKNIFDVLSDRQKWSAFSASTAAAMKTARTWGLALTNEQAETFLAVLGRFQLEMMEAQADFLNFTFRSFKGTNVLVINANTYNPIENKIAGVKGGGGGPHEPWEYVVGVSSSAMTQLIALIQGAMR